MDWFKKKFWVISGELFVVGVRERPKNDEPDDGDRLLNTDKQHREG